MRPLLLLLVSLFSIACATTRPLAPQETLPTPALGDRMIVEVTSGEVLPLEPVLRDLRTVNHLYVGERHAVPGYQDTQLEVVRALDSVGAHIGIGVEWLPMETQGTVDAFIAGELTESEFMT